MKTVFLFALMALAAADDDLYDVENLDMVTLSSNTVEFKKLVDCIVNKLSHLKPYSKVVKCTADMKKAGYYFFESLKTNSPEDYVLFKKIYDPENKYLEALEIELNKYKPA